MKSVHGVVLIKAKGRVPKSLAKGVMKAVDTVLAKAESKRSI